MDYQNIICEQQDGITRISLNRPESLNGMTMDMCRELIEATRHAAEDRDTRVVIITGMGKAFCVGGDLSSPMYHIKDPGELEKVVQTFGQVAVNLRNMPKPVIAMINGAAAGGGFGLALAADILIASEKAKLGHVYLNIGVQSDTGAIYFLPRLIGVARAAELVFSGRVVDAFEARDIGLVNRVVPPDQLEDETMKLARRLAKGPAFAMGMAKRALYQCLTMDLATAVEYEARGHVMTMLSDDMQEGIAAFKEKREPRFPSTFPGDKK